MVRNSTFKPLPRGGLRISAKIWKMAKYARRREINQIEPEYFGTIQREDRVATKVEEKAGLFREECFPPPPQADLADLDNHQYRAQLIINIEISEEEMLTASGRTKPDKAPGPDGITNRVAKLVILRQRQYEKTLLSLSKVGIPSQGVSQGNHTNAGKATDGGLY